MLEAMCVWRTPGGAIPLDVSGTSYALTSVLQRKIIQGKRERDFFEGEEG